MNLVDLLAPPKVPDPQKHLADLAEVAESQQRRGLQSPPPVAESGGFGGGKGGPVPSGRGNPPNPPALADAAGHGLRGFPPDPPDPPCANPPARGFPPNPPTVADSGNSVVTGFPPNPPNPPLAMVESPIPETVEHFAAHGCRLMREDLAFVRERLPTGTALRNQAIRQYVTIWQEAMAQEPLEHCRQNAGRFQANTWLRCRKDYK